MGRVRRHRRLTAVGLGTLTALVAAAVVFVVSAAAANNHIDLTTAGANTTANGAIWAQGVGPAGTGQFDPFLTLSTNASTEAGWNAASGPTGDAFYGGTRTHTENAAVIPPVVVNGVKYREFGLDANDQGSDDYMSIDKFKLYLDDQASLTGYTDGAGNTAGTFSNDTGPTAQMIYTLPADTDVLLRSQALSSGSGQSDITVLVPDSLFPSNCSYGSTTCDKYVILFNADGGAGTLTAGNGCSSGCNYDVTAGFEEWRTRQLPVVAVNKTAVPSFTRTFPWSVKKYVSVDGGTTWEDASANLNLFNGDSSTIKWKIDYTKGTGVDSGSKVTGTVTVSNPTGSAPFFFSVTAVVTSLSDVITQTGLPDTTVGLTCPGVTFPKTLNAGDSFQCTYSQNLSNTTAGTNTATAAVTGAGNYSGSHTFDFSGVTPTLKDDTASLDDNFDSNLPTTVSGSGSITYDQNQGCGTTRTVTNTAVITATDSGTQSSDPAALNITCYGLTTTKDANPSFGRTFDWTVKKYVSLDGVTYDDTSVTLNEFNGDTGTLYWKIVPTRGAAQDGSYSVSGTITVTNSSPLNATGVTVADSIAGVGAVSSVDCDAVTAGNQTTVNIAAGGSATCTYGPVTLPDGTTRLNTATATLFGHDYSGTASIDFTNVTPTTTDATANLDDDLDPGLPAAATSGTAVTYTTSAPCGSSRTIDNTAVLTEGDSGTQRTDPASATVNCLSLTVTKTATPSFRRTWTWSVLKGAADSALTLDLGQTFLEPYSVTYTATKTDDQFNVSGSITVTSPANAPTRTVDVSDVYAGSNATVDCNGSTAGSGLPASLAGGGTLNCTYSVDLNAATNGNNVAKATLSNSPSGTTDFTSNSVAVTFGAPTSEVDETVNVTDTVPAGSYCTGLNTPVTGCTVANAGTGPPSGSITASLPSPFHKTFTYTRIIGPYGTGECGDHTIDNTADFTTTDTAATGSSSVSIPVHVPCPVGCTLTQGYWKTHSARGPAPFDDNWNNLPGGLAENTVFFLSGQTWYQVFWTAPKGNAYYQLAHQYEAAVLNILNGADPSAVASTITTAETLFATYTPAQIGAMKSTNPVRQQFITLAGILGSYNEGKIGPGHCSEDQTSSSSP